MNNDKYVVSASESNDDYHFISEGPKGKVRKIVQYSLQNEDLNMYNLAFGDYDEISGRIDDKAITNNNDMAKVLATVIETIVDYTRNYPNRLVYFEGSSTTRTKLYCKIIRDHFEAMRGKFYIFGSKFVVEEGLVVGSKIFPFEPGTEYDAYIVLKREDV